MPSTSVLGYPRECKIFEVWADMSVGDRLVFIVAEGFREVICSLRVGLLGEDNNRLDELSANPAWESGHRLS